MKNSELWKPTKFELGKKGLRATRNGSGGAILIGDILAKTYERLIHDHARGLLLDLCCGSVPLYGVYKDLINDNICIDWRHTNYTNIYLDYECDVNCGIPLDDEHVDTIIITDALEHINNPDCIWSEMHRVLRKHGKIIAGIPFLYNVHEEPFDYYRFTAFALKYFCDKYKFSIVELTSYGGTPEVILTIIGNHLSRFKLTSCVYSMIAKAIVSTSISKYVSRLTASKFPLGYGIVAQKL